MPLAFEWRGLVIDGIPALVGTIGDIVHDGTKEDAIDLRDAYRAVSQHADENIGFLAGEFNSEDAQRVLDWFEVEHPIAGKTVPVSPMEAFRLGAQWMKERSEQ